MGETIFIDPAYAPLLNQHGLRDLNAFFEWKAGDRLDKPKLAPWRERWRLKLPEADGGTRVFYLKRFLRPPWRHQVKRWQAGHWGTSTAGVEMTNARLLNAAGIAAVRVAAYGQEMAGPWECRSFVLLCAVPGESLERWLPANLEASDRERDPEGRRRRIDALARLVASFHRAGFVHRDLYLSHVFFHPAAGTPAEEYTLIDLQRVFRPRFRGRRWAVKDLAALHASTPARVEVAERLRFLSRYVRVCPGFGSARGLVRLVERKAARMARDTGRAASAPPTRNPQLTTDN